jgi:catechol 2,3-dioxygenase-like lactoylglutathione lyase family enzyme
MLGKFPTVATVPVKDLDRAKEFYSEKLGLEQIGAEGQAAVSYRAGGGTTLLVYRSQYAGQNDATAVTWNVEKIQDVVRDLKSKGIAFEHYDMPNTKLEGDVYSFGDLHNAWFKDLDGNIHSIVSRS